MKMLKGVFLDVLSRIPLTLLASSSLQDRTVGVSQTWSPKTASVQAVNRAPRIFWSCLSEFFFFFLSDYVFHSSATLLFLFHVAARQMRPCSYFFSILLYLFVSPFCPPPATQRNTLPVFSQLHFKIPTAGGVTDGVNCCLRSTCLLEKWKPRHFMKWGKKTQLCQMESTHSLAKQTSSCGSDTT